MLVTADYVPRNEKEHKGPQMGGGGRQGRLNITEKRKKYYDCPVYKYPIINKIQRETTSISFSDVT